MSKKKNVLKETITKINNKSHNYFIKYLLKLQVINFGVNENENFLKNKYEDILKFYWNREKNENKGNRN